MIVMTIVYYQWIRENKEEYEISRKKNIGFTIKLPKVKMRDYVLLGEILHGSGRDAHRTTKDKLKDRKSKLAQREKNKLKVQNYN